MKTWRRAGIVLLAILATVGIACGKPKGERDPSGPVGTGRICEFEGQQAGHGGQVYECVKLPDGRLVWERQVG